MRKFLLRIAGFNKEDLILIRRSIIKNAENCRDNNKIEESLILCMFLKQFDVRLKINKKETDILYDTVLEKYSKKFEQQLEERIKSIVVEEAYRKGVMDTLKSISSKFEESVKNKKK